MGSLATNSAYRALKRSYPGLAEFLVDCVDVVNNILRGKLNNTGSLTLTANATTTTLTDERIGANSSIELMPTTANAAGALATTYFNTFADGSCVVNHANAATVDRVFRYTITG